MSSRAERLVSLLDNVDILLVTELVNLRYLAGYTGSNGIALIGPATRAFITDFRYLEQSAEEVSGEFDRLIAQAPLELTSLIEGALPACARQGPWWRRAPPGRAEVPRAARER